MHRLLMGLIVGFVFMMGCATPTPYQPMAFKGGYSDYQLDKNTIKVSFRGNAFIPKEKVEVYLLYRCAEVTSEFGYDYFVIVDNVSDTTRGFVTAPGTYTGNTYQYGYGATTLGTYMPGQTISIKKHSASVLIKLFKGEKPENIPNAFAAEELKGYLEKHIKKDGEPFSKNRDESHGDGHVFLQLPQEDPTQKKKAYPQTLNALSQMVLLFELILLYPHKSDYPVLQS